MPLTRALYEFCNGGERITTEEIYPAPSFWHELLAINGSDLSKISDY
jgi:hypothetical protein